MWLLLAVLILLFWGGGLAFSIGGQLIHMLLVLFVLALLLELVSRYVRTGGPPP